MNFRKGSPIAVAAMALVLLVSAFVDSAEARRGGSFGSRGARTYSSPAITQTAPSAAAPIQRSMTPQTQSPTYQRPGYATQPSYSRPGGFFGGFGGSLLGGLALGGVVGMLLGHGFGGIGGGFGGGIGAILQIAILAFGAMFLFRYFANRNQPRPASGNGFGGGSGFGGPDLSQRMAEEPARPAFGGLAGFGGRPAARPVNALNANDEVGITQADLDSFERLLYDVQSAFGREDYAALRQHSTPEVMSYLAEELSDNATHGLRNEVKDVKLLQGDLSEAWSEGDVDYATVAMRYESRDAMRKRDTNEVVSGNADQLTEAREIWTFARRTGEPWKLSAIQEV